MTARWVLAIVLAASLAHAGPTTSEAPPPKLLAGSPASASAVEGIFAHFKHDRLRCKFSEEKHIALLAKPLRATGTIYFARDKGIARLTATPKAEQLVVTTSSVRIRKGTRTEEIPLDKSKDLKAFALIVPTLLRGDRAGIQQAFNITLHGSDKDWWALTFVPKSASLAKLVKKVVVFGKKTDVFSLQITEQSGDTTNTRLSEIVKNADVPDAELASAFGQK